jgi:hypothetical protein
VAGFSFLALVPAVQNDAIMDTDLTAIKAALAVRGASALPEGSTRGALALVSIPTSIPARTA